MRWSRFRGSNFLKISIVGLSLMLVSACETGRGIQDALNGAGTHMVSVPPFEASSELKAAKKQRVKVASIDVAAPRKGEELFSSGLRRVGGVPIGRREFYSTYLLVDDFEPVVRQALDHVFEIDPNSDKSAKVEATIKIDNYFTRSWWCQYWVTTTTVGMNITVTAKDGTKTQDHFDSDVEDKSCAIQFLFPSGGTISNNIQKAFQQMMLKTI